ncbi:MAG TPA: hypothetical protein VJQ45_01775 [Ktedonobacterales bacterium]|nr:hypothetical protein [Ktedonobacterales bacterium]
MVLIGLSTAGALLGLRALPSAQPGSYHHMHGLVVAIRGEREFALEVPGHRGMEWFEIAPGTHISMAHLRRHLRERAPTDVTFEVEGSSMLMAMSAD